jgi:hypothetical protein
MNLLDGDWRDQRRQFLQRGLLTKRELLVNKSVIVKSKRGNREK